jgi:hypothetical protein
MNTEEIKEANALISAVAAQRNAAHDQVAFLNAKLAVANAKIADLEQQLSKTKTTKETDHDV